MTVQVFAFYGIGGVIPNIPNQTFAAGTKVSVDMDTMTVLAITPIGPPPDVPEVSAPEPVELVDDGENPPS